MPTKKGLEELKRDIKVNEAVRKQWQVDPAQVFVKYGLADKVEDFQVKKAVIGVKASRTTNEEIKCACGCAFSVELEAEG